MTKALMTTVDIETVGVGVTAISSLFTFVDVRTSKSITTVTIRTCTSETTYTIGTRGHSVTAGLAVRTLVNIDTLSITEHKSW